MKKAVAFFVGIFLIGLMLIGCAGTQGSATRSIRPQVNINSPDIKKIKSAIIDDFKNVGFKVVSESDRNIVLSGKRLGYTTTDIMHAMINMVTTGNSTRVTAQAYLRSQASFGREQYTEDISHGVTGAELQRILEGIKVQVESQ
jgi:hypothetical protein